jgi:AraC-like DNA-binding protein
MIQTTVRRPHGITQFATSGIPDARRIALWEQHNARSLVGLKARTLDGESLEAVELNLNLPSLQLAKVTGTPHVVERDARQIAEHPAEGVVAYFALRGQGTFYHRGGCEMLSPGQGIIYDADQPFSRGFADGLSELALKIPRATLKELTGRPNLARPYVFRFGGPVTGGTVHARALARSVGGALGGSAVEWDALETTVTGLLGSLLGDCTPGGHVAAADAFIAAHLADPDLTAGRIAAAVGISERQLSRLFAESGRSIPQAVLEARLAAVRSSLADPAQARMPLSEVAARFGFASQASFSRSYRAHFGTTPLRDRRMLLTSR